MTFQNKWQTIFLKGHYPIDRCCSTAKFSCVFSVWKAQFRFVAAWSLQSCLLLQHQSHIITVIPSPIFVPERHMVYSLQQTWLFVWLYWNKLTTKGPHQFDLPVLSIVQKTLLWMDRVFADLQRTTIFIAKEIVRQTDFCASDLLKSVKLFFFQL